jgi:hypothetical protein
MGVPKLPKLGFLWLWKPITLCADLWLKWDLKQSCSPHWELFNDMSHTTYMQVSQSDSQLLMVESQIGNLTPYPSFDHNLCFNHSNGSWKPILNIYVLRDFQWYNKLQNLIRFWPLQSFSKDSEIHWDFNSQSGNLIRSVKVHSLTFSYTPENMKCESQASLLAHTLISPCLSYEPKATVVTFVTPHPWTIVFLVWGHLVGWPLPLNL